MRCLATSGRDRDLEEREAWKEGHERLGDSTIQRRIWSGEE